MAGKIVGVRREGVKWAVNAYGDKLDPNPLTMVIDDAAISKSRISVGLAEGSK